MERPLLLLVLAAVLDADRRRQIQAGDRSLGRCHAGAEVDPFEPRRHGDVPLQILAPHLGLAWDFFHRRQRAERPGPPGRAHEQRVLDGVHRRAIRLRKPHAGKSHR